MSAFCNQSLSPVLPYKESNRIRSDWGHCTLGWTQFSVMLQITKVFNRKSSLYCSWKSIWDKSCVMPLCWICACAKIQVIHLYITIIVIYHAQCLFLTMQHWYMCLKQNKNLCRKKWECDNNSDTNKKIKTLFWYSEIDTCNLAPKVMNFRLYFSGFFNFAWTSISYFPTSASMDPYHVTLPQNYFLSHLTYVMCIPRDFEGSLFRRLVIPK